MGDRLPEIEKSYACMEFTRVFQDVYSLPEEDSIENHMFWLLQEVKRLKQSMQVDWNETQGYAYRTEIMDLKAENERLREKVKKILIRMLENECITACVNQKGFPSVECESEKKDDATLEEVTEICADCWSRIYDEEIG